MRTSVICVSHTEGAGGHEIGRLLAERVQFRYADDEIILDAARAEKIFPEAVMLAESRKAGRHIEVDFNRLEQTEKVRQLIRDAIGAAAEAGNVVIVAHAASHALGDRDDVLRVLITASPATRSARLQETLGCDADKADDAVRKGDAGRSDYLKRFYGIRAELPTHYDLVVNTDKLSPELAARLIVHAAS